MKRVGILAVQGDFEAHGKMLECLGVTPVFVRKPADLAGLRGLILPGGESSTQLRFLQDEGLFAAIQEFAAEGGALFGTCAGAILLADRVMNPAQDSLGLVRLTVVRNGYGRQLDSRVVQGACSLTDVPLEMVFIRAPVIEAAGPGVAVLAEREGRPVLVQQGNVLAATFHPELTRDTTVHAHFLQLVRNGN
jgi:5'-phosphate synthase pdxT subunit